MDASYEAYVAACSAANLAGVQLPPVLTYTRSQWIDLPYSIRRRVMQEVSEAVDNLIARHPLTPPEAVGTAHWGSW